MCSALGAEAKPPIRGAPPHTGPGSPGTLGEASGNLTPPTAERGSLTGRQPPPNGPQHRRTDGNEGVTPLPRLLPRVRGLVGPRLSSVNPAR